MKRKLYSFITILTLITLFLTGTSLTAFAKENTDSTEELIMEQSLASTVYYPVSGLSSGCFTGLQCSSPAYFNLPDGDIYINYSFDASNHAGNIVFHNGTTTRTAVLLGDGNAHNTHVNLPNSGRWKVVITSSAASYGIEKTYGYDLYR